MKKLNKHQVIINSIKIQAYSHVITLFEIHHFTDYLFFFLNRHAEAAGCVTFAGLPPCHPEAVTSAEGQAINMAFTYPSPFVQGRVLKQVLNFVRAPHP
jgi:hypothetical protein